MRQRKIGESRETMVKNRWAVLLFCIAIAVTPILLFLLLGSTGDTSGMSAKYLETQEDGNMVFQLSLSGSGVAFSFVSQEVEECALIIKPRVSLVSPFHKKGTMQVVSKFPQTEIEEVYLEGAGPEDRELVWSSNENVTE